MDVFPTIAHRFKIIIKSIQIASDFFGGEASAVVINYVH